MQNIKTTGAKTYYASVLKSGMADTQDPNHSVFLTTQTVNEIVRDLTYKTVLLEHIQTTDSFYQNQNQIVGRVLESFDIGEYFQLEDKRKITFKGYASVKMVIDDLQTIKKIDDNNWCPSIHYTYDVDKTSSEINENDNFVQINNVKYKIINIKAHNLAIVPSPRFATQIVEDKNSLTESDLSLLAGPRSLFKRISSFNCINSKVMFGGKKESKNIDNNTEMNASQQILEEINNLKTELLQFKQLFIENERKEQKEEQKEKKVEEPINNETETKQVANESIDITPSVQPEVIEQPDVKNENEEYIKKSELEEIIAKAIEKAIANIAPKQEVKNTSESEKAKEMQEAKKGYEVNEKKESINSQSIQPVKAKATTITGSSARDSILSSQIMPNSSQSSVDFSQKYRELMRM
jgi:hypothetical protein